MHACLHAYSILWDIETGQRVTTCQQSDRDGGAVLCLALAGDNRTFVAGDTENEAKVAFFILRINIHIVNQMPTYSGPLGVSAVRFIIIMMPVLLSFYRRSTERVVRCVDH